MILKRVSLDIIVVILCWAVVGGGAGLLQGRLLPPTARSGKTLLEEIDLARLKAALEKPDPIVLLDAREEYYFNQGHLPGAVSFPRSQFDFRIEELRPRLAGKEIIVYCAEAECPDAGRVAGRLRKLGIANVSIYRGGWKEWRESQGR